MKLRPGLVIAAAFITLTCLSSCIRTYTCECQVTYSGQPGLPDTISREYSVSDTKKKAKSACEGNSSTSENGGIKAIEDCHLY
ncbi:MAG: hypothetical protein EOP51_11290 [Sphingobacteriales bacterium]|nr:MAG: hypothetical protein EOP51_11290 [Sphingobacteriales bacterium]